MQIIDNKALLLNVRHPQHIIAAIPDSKMVPNSGTQVLVRWRLDEAQVLKNLGIQNVPSPILRDYDWPGMYKPLAHQRKTASFLTLHKRAFNFSQPGTGKTAAAIWAADYLMLQGRIRRVLVICPLSIMESAWCNDVFSTAMHRRVDVCYGAAAKRKAIIAGGAEIVVINFDGVEIVQKEIAAGGFDLIIVDEASAYQTTTTARWKTLNALVKPDTWLWMMTGTPAAQGPDRAYGLIKLVAPNRAPKFFSGFRDMVMVKVNQFKYAPKPNASEIVHDLMQPAIRFTKAECLDLPPVMYTKRKVEMSAQQTKYYEILRKRMQAQAAGETITAANAAIQMNKLLQVSLGAVYTDTGEALQFDIAPRYKVLREVIDETPNKVIVFVNYQHAIRLLMEQLSRDGYTVEHIDGSVPPTRRNAIFHAFQTTPDPKVLLLQPQAAAHGITLTAADTSVWWGPTSSLELYEQGNARIDRHGQKNPMTVVQLYASGVEYHYYKLLDSRIDIHSQLITKYQELLS